MKWKCSQSSDPSNQIKSVLSHCVLSLLVLHKTYVVYRKRHIIRSIALKHWLINFREVMSYIPILVPVSKAVYVNQRFRQKDNEN